MIKATTISAAAFLSKKEKLFFCLKFFHCEIWTVNSGFILRGLIPGTYCHIPCAFLYVCKGYSYGIFTFCTFYKLLTGYFSPAEVLHLVPSRIS